MTANRLGDSLRLPDDFILDVTFWLDQEFTMPMYNDYVMWLEDQVYLTFLGREEESPVDPIVTAQLAQAITLSSYTVAIPTDKVRLVEATVSTALVTPARKRDKGPSDTKSNKVTP